MKSKSLARFITQNGIKKSWFAAKIGISRELLRHYLLNTKSLPDKLAKRCAQVLKRIEKNSRF